MPHDLLQNTHSTNKKTDKADDHRVESIAEMEDRLAAEAKKEILEEELPKA